MTIHVFGDSIATGAAAQNLANRFPDKLAELGTVVKHGVSTAMAVDQWDAVVATSINAGDISVIFDGTNDQACYGFEAAKRGYYIDAQRATAVRLAAEWLPAVPGNVVFTGSWGNGYAYGTYASGVPGDKATFIATGSRTVLGMLRQANNFGSFRVKVAGIDKGVFAVGGEVTTLLGRHFGPAALAFDTIPGDTVEISVVSADASNVVFFQWFSCCAAKARVFLCNIPHAVAYTYGGNDANVDAYNADLSALVAELTANGLAVSLVEVCSLLTPADMHDNVHPNDSGHLKIYAALRSAMVPSAQYVQATVWRRNDGAYFIGDGADRKQLSVS